jgi:hypothetical protein
MPATLSWALSHPSEQAPHFEACFDERALTLFRIPWARRKRSTNPLEGADTLSTPVLMGVSTPETPAGKVSAPFPILLAGCWHSYRPSPQA